MEDFSMSVLYFEKVNEFSLKALLGMAIKAEIGAKEVYESMAVNVDIETLREN